MAVLWMDNSQKVTDVHIPAADGNFSDEQGSSVK
jgi:hypothetical protein